MKFRATLNADGKREAIIIVGRPGEIVPRAEPGATLIVVQDIEGALAAFREMVERNGHGYFVLTLRRGRS